MKGKFKSLIKFLALWGTLFTIFIMFSFYQDIRENKLHNYDETYLSKDVEVSSQQISDTKLKYVFKVTSHDDFLGSIRFSYFRLKGNPGKVIFRIKDSNSRNWYAENTYDFSYFNDDDDYSFGFPEITNSKNKNYIVEFEIASPNLSERLDTLNLNRAPALTVKYVFPSDTIYKSPQQLAHILINRLFNVLSKLHSIKIFFLTLIFSVLLYLILNHRPDTKRSFEIKNTKKLKSSNTLINDWIGNVNPFWIPTLILIILFLAFISGNFHLAEKMSEYLWVSLSASAAFYIIKVNLKNKLDKLKGQINLVSNNTISIIDDLLTKKIFLIIGILIVIIFSFSKTYYLGGDDSRIFYLFPHSFLENYAKKIVSDTGLSQLTNSIPPASLSAFLVLMIGLKVILPWANLQALLGTANIVGGMLTFYVLFDYLTHPKNKYERVIGSLSSFMYVFSIFNFYTLFNSRLMAEYLISLFPLTIYFVIRAIKEAKIHLIVLCAIIWSTFNFFSVTLPLSSAALITTVPLLVFSFWKQKIRTLYYFTIATVVLVILNLHWIAYIPFTNFAKNIPGSSSPSIVSDEFRKQNESGIKTVSQINNVFFPLLNSYHQKIQLDFHWPQLPIYNNWYSKIILSGYLLIGIVIFAGIVISKREPRLNLYIVGVSSFLLAIYFFTVNITSFGVPMFLWLSAHLPGFVMFRNMYDKFAYGLSFQWAWIISISSLVVIRYIKSERTKAYLLFLFCIICLLNAKPFLLGEFENLPYWTTKHSYDGIRTFNRDYIDMLNFIKKSSATGRYLSLPLLSGNSVIVQDEFDKNRFYAGVSPLLLLTGKNDMSGLISFGDKSKQVFKWLEKKDYESFGKLLQQYNVQYVIVDNLIPDDLQNSFMFSDGLFFLQTSKFFDSLLGEKIEDFGQKYSLYKISPKYSNEKIYISNDPEDFAATIQKIEFVKIASHEYLIKIPRLNAPQSLVFLDPFLTGWQLSNSEGKVLENHYMVLDYANAWYLDPATLGEKDLNLRLYFKPHDYYLPTQAISILGYSVAILFVIKSLRRQK